MNFTLHSGDCLAVLRTLPAQSVQCCVTSPPYYGLRDYGHSEQVGLEKTPQQYIEKLVQVFREVRRVLRNDGTLWLNLGDSYSSPTKGSGGTGKSTLGAASGGNGISPEGIERSQKRQAMDVRRLECGLPQKQLLAIPWRVALALQADGWYLRQDIIWHKPNPMPESVTDRCTKAHEYIFLLSKSDQYYFDHEAIKEQAQNRAPGNRTHKNADRAAVMAANGNHMERTKLGLKDVQPKETRNRRSVWTVGHHPYKGAHFAVFPPDLIRPCVLAGCPAGGLVLDPFGGSGTTAQVALEEGRKAVLIELNSEYHPLIRQRVNGHASSARYLDPDLI